MRSLGCAVGLLAFFAGSAQARDAWTTSRIVGTPEPPPPFIAEAVWPTMVFDTPLDLVKGPDGRMFVVERFGKVWSFNPGEAKPVKTLFADLTESSEFTDFAKPELFSIAFHPRFAETREVFIRTRMDEQSDAGSRVYRAKVDGERLDVGTLETVITFKSGSHCGGNIIFGPDGMLYITTGDARPPSPPDALNTGQDISDLEAAILRIDVDHREGERGYRTPSDNPFVATPGARGELWAYGLRNPWKICFKPQTHELLCGDVGWEMWEMIYRIERGGNYGWSITEGPQPVKPEGLRGPTPILPPVVAHPHTEAASITGGHFFQSPRLPELKGAYLYGDFMTGRIWALWYDGMQVTRKQEIARTGMKPVTFGTDDSGEVYFFDFGADKCLQRLVHRPAPDTMPPFPPRLSETGLFTDTASQKPTAGVFRYKVNAPQWSDGATAERWIALPGNAAARGLEEKRGATQRVRASVPANTVLARTVSQNLVGKGQQRLETQILHNTGREWNAYTYRWNDAQTDAHLVSESGDTASIVVRDSAATDGQRTLQWRFHSRAECIRCHNPEAGSVLGFYPGQLQHGDQIESLRRVGVIDETFATLASKHVLATLDDDSASAEHRARSWLHANCAACHRFQGGGSGAFRTNIEASTADTLLLDALPMQGTFGLNDARVIAPGVPERSTLYHRIAQSGPGHMPQLGAQFADPRALLVLYEWIGSLAPSQTPITPSLDTTSAALAQLHQLDSGELAASERETIITQAQNSTNPQIAALFNRHLRDEQRRSVLGPNPDVKAILALEGDPRNGHTIFTRAGCIACHRWENEGIDIGPELRGIGQKYDRPTLLTHLLQPNQTLAEEWKLTTLVLHDGMTVSGFVTNPGGVPLKLKQLEGVTIQVVPSEIQSRQTAIVSTMPEGLLQNLSAQEAADLLAFLLQPPVSHQP